MQVPTTQTYGFMDRPKTSNVGQRPINELFKTELLTSFKNQTETLKNNLLAVKLLSGVVKANRAQAGATDKSVADFLQQ